MFLLLLPLLLLPAVTVAFPGEENIMVKSSVARQVLMALNSRQWMMPKRFHMGLYGYKAQRQCIANAFVVVLDDVTRYQ